MVFCHCEDAQYPWQSPIAWIRKTSLKTRPEPAEGETIGASQERRLQSRPESEIASSLTPFVPRNDTV